MAKDWSMPMEWLVILQEDKPLATYQELTQFTVSQVYDILEVMELKRMYIINDIRERQAEEARQQHLSGGR